MRRVVRLPVVEANHVVDEMVSGWLRIIKNASSPPPTRAHCILFDEATQRAGYRTGSREERWAGRVQCQAVRCPHNLLMDRSSDRPGRRHGGLAPPAMVTGRGDACSPSCVLDVTDTGPKSSAEVAEIMGYDDKRRVEQMVKEAKEGPGGVALARLESALLGE